MVSLGLGVVSLGFLFFGVVSLGFLFSVVQISTGRKRMRDQSHASGPAGRTHGRDFLLLNVDDSLIACSAPRRWGTASPAVLHVQSPSQLSPGPQQIDDHGPAGRCQAVPVCDQLVECRALPAHCRPGFSHLVVTIWRADNCGTRAAGAIPSASISCVVNHFMRNYLRLYGTRVSQGVSGPCSHSGSLAPDAACSISTSLLVRESPRWHGQIHE